MPKVFINNIKSLIHRFSNAFGVQISRLHDPVIDSDAKFLAIYEKCQNYTMTPKVRMYALYKSVQYIISNNIPGDFVECGVWKGGNCMLIALTLQEHGITDRKIYLYDTYEGMTEPEEIDHRVHNPNIKARSEWSEKQNASHNDWCYASLEEVKSNMELTKYPQINLVFVKGKVEETIPTEAPSTIALLRLDTDWYSSTLHELVNLYPKLSNKGVLIIDDYGCWAGSKQAVDEYFTNEPILLNRIDNDARIGQKLS